MVTVKFNSITRKRKFRAFIQIFLCILLVFSVIQIIPIEIKVINDASASSTWSQTNWSAPDNYSNIKYLETIDETGDLKLFYGQ
jgi:hypothetical protein